MSGPADQALKQRASKVIPGGMYGHQSVSFLPPSAPQFFKRAEGAYLWDHDDKRYIDFMSAYGPNLFGYCHAQIDAAYTQQMQSIDVATGPTALMVDLAEAYADLVTHCDWSIFCKNGTDATSIALMIARAHRNKKKILMATGAYHGAAPWCTPMPAGTVADDRKHFIYYQYNDASSLRAAAEDAGEDLAGIFASPFKHDVLIDQELPNLEYAKAVRQICDDKEAVLIIDDVRAGFRMERDCSWHSLGVEPDLSSWGKAIANGHPISCLMGSERTKKAASDIYTTGSFWFAGAAMAAALKTLEIIKTSDYIEHTVTLGTILRDGLNDIASKHSLNISQTGPVQMPLIMFNDDAGNRDMMVGTGFADGMIKGGAYFHHFHNMFINAAMTQDDITQTLELAQKVISSITTPQKA